jgi:hypothetical protein
MFSPIGQTERRCYCLALALRPFTTSRSNLNCNIGGCIFRRSIEVYSHEDAALVATTRHHLANGPSCYYAYSAWDQISELNKLSGDLSSWECALLCHRIKFAHYVGYMTTSSPSSISLEAHPARFANPASHAFLRRNSRSVASHLSGKYMDA